MVAPGAVVFKSTLTVLLPALAMARSSFSSPLKSPIEMDSGEDPVAKVVLLEYEGVVAPGEVVFKSTLTLLLLGLPSPWFEMARSGLPSPFKSPIDTEMGLTPPVAKVVWLEKEGVVAPGVVVFKRTLTLLPL